MQILSRLRPRWNHVLLHHWLNWPGAQLLCLKSQVTSKCRQLMFWRPVPGQASQRHPLCSLSKRLMNTEQTRHASLADCRGPTAHAGIELHPSHFCPSLKLGWKRVLQWRSLDWYSAWNTFWFLWLVPWIMEICWSDRFIWNRAVLLALDALFPRRCCEDVVVGQ